MLLHLFIDMINFQTSAYDTGVVCLSIIMFLKYWMCSLGFLEKNPTFLKSHTGNLERENLKFLIPLESFGHLY